MRSTALTFLDPPKPIRRGASEESRLESSKSLWLTVSPLARRPETQNYSHIEPHAHKAPPAAARRARPLVEGTSGTPQV